MAKKIFMIGFAMIILCLCCGVCFAAEDNSVTLGNEIMQSIDKTKESANNVVSGNWINDAENTVRNAGDNMKNDTKAMTGTSNYNRKGLSNQKGNQVFRISINKPTTSPVKGNESTTTSTTSTSQIPANKPINEQIDNIFKPDFVADNKGEGL